MELLPAGVLIRILEFSSSSDGTKLLKLCSQIQNVFKNDLSSAVQINILDMETQRLPDFKSTLACSFSIESAFIETSPLRLPQETPSNVRAFHAGIIAQERILVSKTVSALITSAPIRYLQWKDRSRASLPALAHTSVWDALRRFYSSSITKRAPRPRKFSIVSRFDNGLESRSPESGWTLSPTFHRMKRDLCEAIRLRSLRLNEPNEPDALLSACDEYVRAGLARKLGTTLNSILLHSAPILEELHLEGRVFNNISPSFEVPLETLGRYGITCSGKLSRTIYLPNLQSLVGPENWVRAVQGRKVKFVRVFNLDNYDDLSTSMANNFPGLTRLEIQTGLRPDATLRQILDCCVQAATTERLKSPRIGSPNLLSLKVRYTETRVGVLRAVLAMCPMASLRCLNIDTISERGHRWRRFQDQLLESILDNVNCPSLVHLHLPQLSVSKGVRPLSQLRGLEISIPGWVQLARPGESNLNKLVLLILRNQRGYNSKDPANYLADLAGTINSKTKLKLLWIPSYWSNSVRSEDLRINLDWIEVLVVEGHTNQGLLRVCQFPRVKFLVVIWGMSVNDILTLAAEHCPNVEGIYCAGGLIVPTNHTNLVMPKYLNILAASRAVTESLNLFLVSRGFEETEETCFIPSEFTAKGPVHHSINLNKLKRLAVCSCAMDTLLEAVQNPFLKFQSLAKAVSQYISPSQPQFISFWKTNRSFA